MSIILVRHGETALNASRVIQPPDTPLSARGAGQAQAVARRLESFAPSAVLSSDLARALQTAEAIAATAALPLQTTELLHERNFGELRGRGYDSLGYDPIHDERAPPGGESMAEFRLRVDEAFARMLALRASLEGPLVVVSHGLVIRVLLERHLRLPAGTLPPERLANTSVTVFAQEPPWQASLVNCAAHLVGDLSDDHRAIAGV